MKDRQQTAGGFRYQEVFTPLEAAAFLRISVRTLRRRMADGSLKWSKVGNLIRIERRAIFALLKKAEVNAASSDRKKRGQPVTCTNTSMK